MENGCDVVVFLHSHLDPYCTVLNILQSLQAFVRYPNENSITVIQSGGDKGVDPIFGISLGESGTEFGNISEMVGKEEILPRFLIWASKVSCGSNSTPRLVRVVERGMSWPEMVITVMEDDWI